MDDDPDESPERHFAFISRHLFSVGRCVWCTRRLKVNGWHQYGRVSICCNCIRLLCPKGEPPTSCGPCKREHFGSCPRCWTDNPIRALCFNLRGAFYSPEGLQHKDIACCRCYWSMPYTWQPYPKYTLFCRSCRDPIIEKQQFIALYFARVLECDSPILEALFQSQNEPIHIPTKQFQEHGYEVFRRQLLEIHVETLPPVRLDKLMEAIDKFLVVLQNHMLWGIDATIFSDSEVMSMLDYVVARYFGLLEAMVNWSPEDVDIHGHTLDNLAQWIRRTRLPYVFIDKFKAWRTKLNPVLGLSPYWNDKKLHP